MPDGESSPKPVRREKVNALQQWHRRARWLHDHRVPVLPGLIVRMNRMIFACDLPLSVELREGTHLVHNGLGVVLHPSLKVGAHTTILQNVTIGGDGRGAGHPVIKDGVYIGAGAVIVGDIVIGSGARIGANAVVLSDVPDFHLAVGIPAVTRPLDRTSAPDC